MSSLITNATIQIRKDTAGNWTSNNPTPAAGEWCKETDTGNLKQGDGSTAWTALGYNISQPETYNIASANTVIALPDITGSVQRKTYYWTGGDGSHTFSFTVSDASTIGGIAATLWIGEGTGNITIESDGSNWQVKGYEDSGSITDSGINKDRKWWKDIDGTLRFIGAATATLVNVASFSYTATFGITFSVAPLVIPCGLVGYGASHFLAVGVRTVANTTSVVLQSRDTDATLVTGSFDSVYSANGRWRT